jgi:hypothetical protein
MTDDKFAHLKVGPFTLIILDPPTTAEVRACKISLAEEALVKMRACMSCPGCGDVHPPHADAMLLLIEEGFKALYEDAQASRRKLREKK